MSFAYIDYFNDLDTTDYGCTIFEQPEWTSHWDWVGNTTHKLTFKVLTKSINGHRAGPIVVGRFMRQQGYKIGIQFYRPETTERDVTTLLTELDITCSGGRSNPNEYTVECTFTRVTNLAGLENPLGQIFPEQWSTELEEIPMWRDYNGDFIVNKAGDFLTPPITATVSKDILIFERNEDSYDHDYANLYRNTCNADVWNGYAAKMVRCRNISATKLEWPNSNATNFYYHVVYEFEFWNGFNSPDAATVTVLNAGWNQIDSNGVKTRIFDGSDIEPTDIPMLDANGAKLAEGSTPITIDFQKYALSNFDDLNITLTFTDPTS